MWRKVVRILFYVAIACGVVAGITLVFCEPWTIPADDAQLGVSIEPTMSVLDVVLVARATGASDGALVRCTDPDAAGRFVIGRVVAHGGDKVEFRDGIMTVNDKVAVASVACDVATASLKNPATQEEEELHCGLEELGGGLHPIFRAAKSVDRDIKINVDPGKAFLVSDNRAMHLDSRDFLAVTPGNCQRIMLRLWGTGGWFDTKKRMTVLW